MKIYDLTHPIETGMPVFPGDRKTQIVQETSVGKDGFCSYYIEGMNHCGTHIDSPAHMLEGGSRLRDLPLERCVGQGYVLDCRYRIDGEGYIHCDATLLEDMVEGCILFFYTGWDRYYGTSQYYDRHPMLHGDWIDFFLKKKIKIIGIDMPSPDYFPFPFHHALFEAGIYMVENLTHLDQVKDFHKRATFMIIPLGWDLDGSWVRVLVQN